MTVTVSLAAVRFFNILSVDLKKVMMYNNTEQVFLLGGDSMKRYYKSLLSLFMAAVIAFSLFVPAISVSAEEGIIYSEINLVPDGEVSETGYLNEIWIDENGDEVVFDSISDSKPVPNNGSLVPSEYSSAEEGYVTDIRDQKGTNSCWAFSAVAAAESSLLRQGLATKSDSIANLSEAHLVWFTHKSLTTDVTDPTFGDGTNEGSPYTKGGYWLRSTYTVARGAGFALEKDYPFYGDNTSKMGNYDESSRYDSKVTLDEAYLIPKENTDEIKKAIMENGSITVAACVVGTYLNKGEDGYAYYQNVYASTNHQMIIVGWDDDFSVTNFKEDCRPSSDGAWLVKNSYGTAYSDDGYFWISYEEPSLEQFAVEKVSVTNDEESIYQYDGYGYRSGIGGRTESGTPVTVGAEANVFTAEKNEMLSSVSFYTMQDSIEYEISVYKNVTKGKDTPTADGTKSTVVTTGYAEYRGYHKISLSENISLDKGENFAVVVTMYYTGDTTTPLYIPYEGASGSSDGVYICYYSSESGQSYYRLGSSGWIEASADENKNNVCVKAFTTPDNSLEIRTAEEFNAFAQEVASGTSFEGRNVNLMNDIDFDGGEIIPVGTESNPFAGYFRGNGYVLKNGVIESDSDCVGIFSAISQESEIRKLGAENISVTGVYGVGAVCGLNEGIIEYCYSTGSVTGEESTGGLVGINCGTVSDSYSLCDVSSDYYAGSLIGENDGGTDKNCYVSSSSSLEAIGNDTSDVTAVPDKCFANGLAAFYLDGGKSTSRAKVWTKRDGITTFLKSDDEIIYQVELYDKENISSLYLYVNAKDNLKELAEAEKGMSVTIYADPQHKVLYTSVPTANIILYVEWSSEHTCADELTFIEGTDADCYNSGTLSYYECTCGKLYLDENAETEIESTVIPALSHPEESVIKTEKVDATCTEDGNTQYYTCTLCGDVFSDSECTVLTESTTISATGHSYGDWVTEKDADCVHDGLKVKTCSACGDMAEETISAKGHSYEIVYTEPTESTQGFTTYTCTVCGDSYISDYIDPITQVSFSGTVTSYLSETDEILIELIKRGEAETVYSLTATGNNAEFIFEDILSGAYTLRISKNNHATREYAVIIEKEMATSEFKIQAMGDVNGDGKVNSIDVAMVNAQAKGVKMLEEYQLVCADITGDGKVNSIDVARINAHAKGVSSVWK